MGGLPIITGRDADRLAQTKSMIRQDALSFVADLNNENELLDLVKKLPRVQGVVFSAGIVEVIPVKFLSTENISKTFSINFFSQVMLTQQLLKGKKIDRAGSLVYMSSVRAKMGVAGTAMYSSSKAALAAFAKVTASECASQQIRSNCICPGIVISPMTQNSLNLVSEADMEANAASYPLGLGLPKDITGLAVYLLSDASRWMTGSEIILDGGLTLK
jgi:NAD(P)-dependent dehydrogenase (short-subunit alcohol dehydrogenase family)